MVTPANFFDSKRGAEAGRKSKRRAFDVILQEYFEDYFNNAISKDDTRTRREIMIEAAYVAFVKGNYRPLAYLVDRAFGKSKETISLSHTIADIGQEDIEQLHKAIQRKEKKDA